MAKIDPALRKTWKQNPSAIVNLLLRLDGDVSERIEQLEAIDVQVRRRFRLTGGIAVRCKASVALTLGRRSWITKIEEDRPLGGLVGR